MIMGFKFGRDGLGMDKLCAELDSRNSREGCLDSVRRVMGKLWHGENH